MPMQGWPSPFTLQITIILIYSSSDTNVYESTELIAIKIYLPTNLQITEYISVITTASDIVNDVKFRIPLQGISECKEAEGQSHSASLHSEILVYY